MPPRPKFRRTLADTLFQIIMANIQNGVYAIINVEATNICLEMLGPEGGYSVVGKEFRNVVGQKWMLRRDSDGNYALCSLLDPLFLNTAIDPEYGAKLAGTPFTFCWGIESEPGFENIFRWVFLLGPVWIGIRRLHYGLW
ncbi:hypothetical protein EDC04DRAFT_2890696 [Pisolithus marmoratus]|nr:hypothetical protein EDC04DRAFT_2890696 [Pisolithus marmoratus]